MNMSSRGRHIWDLLHFLGLTEFHVQIFSLVNDVWSKYHSTPDWWCMYGASWTLLVSTVGHRELQMWTKRHQHLEAVCVHKL